MAETEPEMTHGKGGKREKDTAEKVKYNEVFLAMVVMCSLFQLTCCDADVYARNGKSFMMHMDEGLFGTRGEQSQD